MDADNNKQEIETSEEGYPIEIYTDERIAEFLAEDELTAEQKKQLEDKLRQPKRKET